MDNKLEIWDKVKQPPGNALKKIGGGRLKGMTDISPQWRLFIMTDTFGPVGFGWKYTIERQWIEDGEKSERCAMTNINLFYKIGDKWSDPIPGTGGSSFVVQEKNGPYTSDEAYKMSLTDALSVAMKTIGVAANIYSNNQEYSKYTAPKNVEEKNQPSQSTNEKPWYNDFNKHKADMILKLKNGSYKSPEEIITALSATFKINNNVREQIKQLRLLTN